MFVFFLFVPLLLPGPWWEGGGRPRILAQGSFLKVKVIEVKGQISVSR